MSGLIKKAGKIFKKVVKVVKKFALPALAIAAVVITGGAALGLIPAIGGIAITGVGSLATALGAGPVLAGILSTAATGATIGMIGGLVSTGTISGALKGGSMGLLAGAAMGGVSALAGGIGGAAAGGAGAAAPAAAAAPGAATGATGFGVGTAEALGMSAVPAAAPAVAQVGTQVAAQAGTSGIGGIMGFLKDNPLLASGVIKGIGGALMGKPEDPALAKLKEIQKSYEGVTFDPADFTLREGMPAAADVYNPIIQSQGGTQAGQVVYDPTTGRILPKPA